MGHVQSEVLSVADACLGGLRGRTALLIGPKRLCQPYQDQLLERENVTVLHVEDYSKITALLPQAQLLLNIPDPCLPTQMLTAARVAVGCIGRRTPLLIFDLAASTSVEELAGLLPAVCLYTPTDLLQILGTVKQLDCLAI